MRTLMKKARWPIAFACLLCVSCTATVPPPASPETVRAEVSTVLQGYLAAMGARDTATIRRSYVNDDRFVWLESGEVRYRDVDGVLASLASFPAESPITTELKDLIVVPVGESAAHAWAQFTTTVGEGPSGFSFGGAISFVLERSDDGWKVVGGHASSPNRQ